MTFTTTPPTTPGFYAWRLDKNHPIEAIHIVSDDKPESNGAARIGRYLSLRETHGEWCRLVPAEEVEKAYREASSYFNGAKSDCSSLRAWQDSRAKQLA